MHFILKTDQNQHIKASKTLGKGGLKYKHIWLIVNELILLTAFDHINSDIYRKPGHLHNYDKSIRCNARG